MKLNGTVRYRMGIYRDTTPGIEDFRNLKSQAPNVNEIPNANFQRNSVCHLFFAIWNFSPEPKSFFNDQTGRPAGQRQV